MMAANHGNEFWMLFFVGLLPAVLLATRALFSRLSKSEGSKLERVVEELAALVEAIHEKEHVHGDKADAFVPIREWMALDETKPVTCGEGG